MKDAINSVLGELNSILGEQVIVRIHTDAGKEFVNKAVDEMLKELRIYPTTMGVYDPKANIRAERYIGMTKQQATSYLSRAKLPSTFW